MNALTNYFRASVEELHHVRWPTRRQAVRMSAIVIGFTLITSVLLGGLDSLLSQVILLLVSFA